MSAIGRLRVQQEDYVLGINMDTMIVKAKSSDLDSILQIYEIAKQYMKDSGNPNQWNGTYPERELLEKDMAAGQLYVCRQDGVIHGVFAFITGEESTYSYIEGGSWLNADPYGTIRRLAGDGRVKGIFRKSMDFCKRQCSNLRADTHDDNHTMQHLLEQYGFVKCGRIYLQNGSQRIAYHYVDGENTKI